MLWKYCHDVETANASVAMPNQIRRPPLDARSGFGRRRSETGERISECRFHCGEARNSFLRTPSDFCALPIEIIFVSADFTISTEVGVCLLEAIAQLDGLIRTHRNPYWEAVLERNNYACRSYLIFIQHQ